MADQNEILERTAKTYALLLMGKKNRDIVKYLAKTYNVCEKTCYIYINKAKEQREHDVKEYRDEAVADQIALLRNLYDKNYKLQDFKECRGILAQLAQLLGLNEAIKTKQDLNITNFNIKDIVNFK